MYLFVWLIVWLFVCLCLPNTVVAVAPETPSFVGGGDTSHQLLLEVGAMTSTMTTKLAATTTTMSNMNLNTIFMTDAGLSKDSRKTTP